MILQGNEKSYNNIEQHRVTMLQILYTNKPDSRECVYREVSCSKYFKSLIRNSFSFLTIIFVIKKCESL